MKKITANTNDDNYIDLLNKNTMKLENVKTILNTDEKTIISIIHKLIMTSNKFKIDMAVLVACFTVKNEIPDKIKKEILHSYKKYVNANNTSKTIDHDIYNISLCGTILGGRRRLLYRDVYYHFVDGYTNMFKDIEKYIDSLNPEFTNLVCKKDAANRACNAKQPDHRQK